MPKIVDREERMQMILLKAMEVFAQYGYRDSNLSLIAEACGFSRPTVYQYFKDKNEIYYYAVKSVSAKMFERYSEIAFRPTEEDEVQRINIILADLFNYAKENESTIENLVEFILAEKKNGVDVYSIIRNRTAKLRILLKRIILQGVHKGTIRTCNVDKVGEELYNLMQAAAFEVGFFSSYSAQDAIDTVSDYIESFHIQ